MLPTPRSILTMITLATCAALLAGCSGGANADDYKAGMRAVGTDISAASEAVAGLPPTASAPERAKAITAQRDAIAAAADRADALDPPSDAKGDHDKLVAALRDYAALLGKLAAVSGDTGKEAELIGDAGPIVDRLAAASKALEKAGYDFATDGEA